MMNHKQISDSWEQGDLYERFIGRWSRQVAPIFLSWLQVTSGQRWLDVGCGTGALGATILDRVSPSFVAGVEPSRGFLQAANRNLSGRVRLSQGTATAIPFAGASMDVIVSALVLNFVGDPRAALVEMARVARKGGTIGAYVWDYAGKMELLRHFWDAAAELNPEGAKLDEGARFPLCNPDALVALFAGVGLQDVEVTAIDLPVDFASFEAYWNPFLGGQGPAPAYLMSLDDRARAQLRERLEKRIPMQADGSISLIARAWAIRAKVMGEPARTS